MQSSEFWDNLSQADIDAVNKLQNYVVKYNQGFKTRTRSDMCDPRSAKKSFGF